MKRELYLTNIEKIMKEALEKNNIDFAMQYPIRGGLILDFAIPEKKLCIECDGETWHKEGNSRDRKRDFVLKKLNWQILRFKGSKIQNDIDECISKIKLCL